MNLAQLKATAAAYHGRKTTDLQIGPVDLFLVAANNARRKAEMLHDFEHCRCSATLAIDAVNGGDIRTATIVEPGFSTIRDIIEIQGLRTATAEFVPVDFMRLDSAIDRRRQQIDLHEQGRWGWRYPSDADVANRPTKGKIVQRGYFLLPYPPSTISGTTPWTAYIEAYGWLADYTDVTLAGTGNVDTDPPVDFFVDKGFAYLQWATILELNALFKTYVPRQEGNIDTREVQGYIDSAWRDLIIWDSYMTDGHSTSE